MGLSGVNLAKEHVNLAGELCSGPIVERMTELAQAARDGNVDKVTTLLAAGADINEFCTNRCSPTTALLEACRRGHAKVVSLLLEAKAIATLACNDYPKFSIAYTPLNNAIGYGLAAAGSTAGAAAATAQLDTIATLLAEGSTVNHSSTTGETSLFALCRQFVITTTGFEQRYGKNFGTGPFNVADDIAAQLLASNADVDHTSYAGCTPLHLACDAGLTKIVIRLLAAAPDPRFTVNRASGNGTTPLYNACESGHANIVKRLIAANAAVNQRACKGATPLYIACKEGRLQVVKVLVAADAEVEKRHGSASPLTAAARYCHTAIVKLLLDAGASPNQASSRDPDTMRLLNDSIQKARDEAAKIAREARAAHKKARKAAARRPVAEPSTADLPPAAPPPKTPGYEESKREQEAAEAIAAAAAEAAEARKAADLARERFTRAWEAEVAFDRRQVQLAGKTGSKATVNKKKLKGKARAEAAAVHERYVSEQERMARRDYAEKKQAHERAEKLARQAEDKLAALKAARADESARAEMLSGEYNPPPAPTTFLELQDAADPTEIDADELTYSES